MGGDLAGNLRRQVLNQRRVAVSQPLAASTRTGQAPLDLLLAQAVEISRDHPDVVGAQQLGVVLANPVDAVTPLAERPWVAQLDQALPQEEVPDGTVQELKER